VDASDRRAHLLGNPGLGGGPGGRGLGGPGPAAAQGHEKEAREEPCRDADALAHAQILPTSSVDGYWRTSFNHARTPSSVRALTRGAPSLDAHPWRADLLSSRRSASSSCLRKRKRTSGPASEAGLPASRFKG